MVLTCHRNRGPPKNPHGKRTRSPSPPSSPSSSSSDSGLSDVPRQSIKHIKRRGATPPSRSPSHPPAVLSRGTPAVKETPCPDPEKFDLKGDHRPFIRACERFIRLRQNWFPTEESKILWALSYLKGSKGNRFTEKYEHQMLSMKYAHFLNWRHFVSMVAKYSKEGEVDVDHTRAMRDLRYN